VTAPARLWIVAVNYNGHDDTRKCLRSLAVACRAGGSVVVVDNASTPDPTPALRAEFPWCDVVRNDVNGGWAGGNNTGVRHALDRDADLVVLLNNDTVVAPDFVERLRDVAARHPEHGVLGPVIRFMEPPHEVMTDGCTFNDAAHPGFFQRLPIALDGAAPAVTDVDIVNGCCMMVRAEAFRRVGLIDERFFLVHEESDFCLRAWRAGFRCGVLGEALVWHKGSSSFKRTGRRWQRYYDTRNLALLLGKHRATHDRGRGAARSFFEYLRYSYHRYTVEREAGQADAAAAVLEGLYDGLARRFGPFAPAARPGLALLRLAFDLLGAVRRLAGRKGAPRAAAVR
jgi:GT2 family glycosyltransferase